MTEHNDAVLWGGSNPVLPGFYPDPSVCRVDGEDGTWFYLVNSTFEYLPGLPIHRSRDLIAWELIGHVIDRPGQIELSAVADSGGLFAPTIRHDGSRFYVVCTLVGGEEGASGNFIVTAEHAQGPWSEPIWWNMDGIDPSIMLASDGGMWAHGTRLALAPEWEQQTEVWVRRLNAETLVPEGAETVIWSGALKGGIWAEGPHLLEHDGQVYLLAAEGGTSFHHAIVVARADSPLGPFTGNPANPILTHRNLGRAAPVSNVGHADLVEAPDGSWWAVCLATRAWNESDILGRETFLVPVTWEDGWPVFAPGEGQLMPNPTGYVALEQPAASAVETVQGIGDLIAVRRAPEELCSETAEGFRLVAGPGLSHAKPAFVARRLTDLTSKVRLRLLGASDGVRAGAALRYSATAYLAVTVGAGRVELQQLTGRDAEVTTTLLPGSAGESGTGTLTMEINGTDAVVLWEPDTGAPVRSERVDISRLCTRHDGGFVGLVYGAVAVGDGGTADFGELRQDA